jgi:hypothetical protein
MGSVPSSSLSLSAHSAARPPHAFSTPAYTTTPCMRSHSSANQRNAPSATSSAAFHHSSPVRQSASPSGPSTGSEERGWNSTRRKSDQ